MTFYRASAGLYGDEGPQLTAQLAVCQGECARLAAECGPLEARCQQLDTQCRELEETLASRESFLAMAQKASSDFS